MYDSTEPPVGQISIIRAMVLLPVKIVNILIMAVIALFVTPIYWIGRLIWYRPPNVVHASQMIRYLRLVWTVQPSAPGMTIFARLWLTLSIVQKALTSIILGLAWLLDELLYGRKLNAISVTAPLFVISAGRSGSTQITRYLEDDPRMVAPNILQSMFPYLWLWKLVPNTLGKVIPPEKVREKIQAMMPPELWERHEADPFRADTFDGPFYSSHLHQISPFLGPDVMVTDFNFARIAPHDQRIKTDDFIAFVDRIGRKTLLNANLEDSASRRFFIKGHFLYAANSLAKHYPDAAFLTVIREPVTRLQSAVNYLRVNPADPALGPVPWAWLSSALEQTEIEYCELEQDWYTQSSDTRRCVVRFTEFVRDLPATMQHVYRDCFDIDELPAHIPLTHSPRERKNYSVNRSLEELGIDKENLRTRLAAYIQWCEADQGSG